MSNTIRDDLTFIGAALSAYDGSPAGRDMRAAMDRITAAIAEASRALEPFHADAAAISPAWSDERRRTTLQEGRGPTVGDVRRAAVAFIHLNYREKRP